MKRWAAIVAVLCAALGMAIPLPVAAAPPVLDLPLACDLPDRCFVAFYVDHDPGPAIADHRCGARAYNNHRGIDFRVRSIADFAAGIPVLAAAGGTVVALRDGMDDIDVEELGRDKVANHANGNTVVLRHDDGWTTEYLHLRRGSLKVKLGERVTAGQALGTMGLSGDTNFPHLHFELRDANHQIVDPFTGQPQTAACQVAGTSLWSAAAQGKFDYRPIEIVAGFADRTVSRTDAVYGRAGAPHVGGTMVFWFEMLGVVADDIVAVQFILPGEIKRKPQELVVKPSDPGAIYRAALLNPQEVTLHAGIYAVVITAKRKGAAVFQQRFEIDVK